MKYQTFFQFFINTCLVAGFLVSLSLRVYWTRGGDDWAYWSGNILMSLIGAFAGFVLIARNMTSYDSGSKVNRSKRITRIVFGIFLVVIWVLILISQLHLLNAGCPVRGCILLN
jgi:hypothetical protein